MQAMFTLRRVACFFFVGGCDSAALSPATRSESAPCFFGDFSGLYDGASCPEACVMAQFQKTKLDCRLCGYDQFVM